MRILIVASIKKSYYAPFIIEQANSIAALGHTIEYFGVNGSGIYGYLKTLSGLKNKIKQFKPDIIHAHYGLSGLLACLQRSVPVLVTYHGSDINVPSVRVFSKIAMCLSAFNIFVSPRNVALAKAKKKFTLQPCGVDLKTIVSIEKTDARKQMNLSDSDKIIVFSGAFDNAVKNSALAKEAVSLIPGIRLIELKAYTKNEVNVLLNAADCMIMTSFTEGSPQVIKEAMASGCPIVSVDVGDVKEITSGIDGCYIAERTPEDIAEKLKLALNFNGKTQGRKRIIELGFENESIAKRLISIYENILK